MAVEKQVPQIITLFTACTPLKKIKPWLLKKVITVKDNIISWSKLIRHGKKICHGCCKIVRKLLKINIKEEASWSGSSEYQLAQLLNNEISTPEKDETPVKK